MKPSAAGGQVSTWFALRISGVLRYAVAAVLVLALSLAIAVSTQDWTWVSRSGGVIVLFGVLLSLRRLFRLGPQNFDEPTEPVVINGNQFNMKVIWQDIQRAGDNYAQASGIILMVSGILIGSYGDLAAAWLSPLSK